jgi:hypothetical protein
MASVHHFQMIQVFEGRFNARGQSPLETGKIKLQPLVLVLSSKSAFYACQQKVNDIIHAGVGVGELPIQNCTDICVIFFAFEEEIVAP